LLLVHLVPSLIWIVVYIPIIIFAVGFGVTSANRGGAPGAGAIAAFLIPGLLVTLVLFVVATWLYVGWIYALALVADKGYKFSAAMALSRRVVRLHFWQNFWLVFLSGLVMMLGFLVLCLGVFVAFPVVTTAAVIQYDRLFRDLKPNTV
jgi:hypothetical protein